MKYKIGDRARVRQDLIVNKLYGTMPFLKEMQVKNITVAELTYRGNVIAENNYIYTDEMLDGLVEDTTATSGPTNAELIAAAEMLKANCKKHNRACDSCPFEIGNEVSCAITQCPTDWKLYPAPHRKTRKEVLLEKFPNAGIDEITHNLCPSVFGFGPRDMDKNCNNDCEACWNAPAESEEE